MYLRMLGLASTFSLTLFLGAAASMLANAQTRTTAAGGLPFEVKAIGTFESPWAMAFLPDGNMLVTQKQGAMILFDPRTGAKRTLSGTPAVSSRGQGALMDIVLAPNFAASKLVYFSYSEAGSGVGSWVALATAILDQAGGVLKDMDVFSFLVVY